MTLRAEFENVLKHHGVTYINPRNTYIQGDEARRNMAQFLDALCAAVPTPSREALEKILQQHFWYSPETEKIDTVHARYPELTDVLMAWASGRETTCEHRGLVCYTADDGVVHKIRTDLQRLYGKCPLCAAPRPSAATP